MLLFCSSLRDRGIPNCESSSVRHGFDEPFPHCVKIQWSSRDHPGMGWTHHVWNLCRSGSMTLRQVHFASVDIELHARYQPGGEESVFDVDRRIAERTAVLPPLPEDR